MCCRILELGKLSRSYPLPAYRSLLCQQMMTNIDDFSCFKCPCQELCTRKKYDLFILLLKILSIFFKVCFCWYLVRRIKFVNIVSGRKGVCPPCDVWQGSFTVETPRGGESLVLHCRVRPSVQAFAIETIKTNFKFSLYKASRFKKNSPISVKTFWHKNATSS